MTFDEYIHSHSPFHAIRTHWVAGLIGSALTTLGVTALAFDAAMPLLAGLGVAVALWLAWITFDFAMAPLHVVHADGTPPAAASAASPPAFVDTQASWWTP